MDGYEYMLLGAMLASPMAEKLVLEKIDARYFSDPKARQLFAALKAKDKVAIANWFRGIKVGDKLLQAVIEAVEWSGKEQIKKRMARDLHDQQYAMSHDQWIEYARRQLNQ